MGGAASVNVNMGRQAPRPSTPTTRLMREISSGRSLFSQLSHLADENAPASPYLSPCRKLGKDRFSFKDGAVRIEHLDHLSDAEWQHELDEFSLDGGFRESFDPLIEKVSVKHKILHTPADEHRMVS